MERELLLLGLLRDSGMHGYRLHEFIERDLATCTDLKKSTAYFLLDKMVKQGWVVEHQEQVGNRPQRRVYRLTEEGEAVFQRLLRENLASYTPSIFVSDTGLAFAGSLRPEEAQMLLRQRRMALVADLEAARQAPPHAGTLQFLVDHRIVHLQSELTWLDQVIERLGQASDESANGSTTTDSIDQTFQD